MPDCCGATTTGIERDDPPMRKQELVHLHGLLAMVRKHLEERGEIPPGAFDTYDDYGIGPTAVAERKDRQREVIDRLLEGLYITVTAQRPIVDTATAPSDSAGSPHIR